MQKTQSGFRLVCERPEGLHHYLRYLITIPLRHEFVPCTGERKQLGPCGDERQRRRQFFDGAESIPRAMYEHRRGLEAGEVLRP